MKSVDTMILSSLQYNSPLMNSKSPPSLSHPPLSTVHITTSADTLHVTHLVLSCRKNRKHGRSLAHQDTHELAAVAEHDQVNSWILWVSFLLDNLMGSTVSQKNEEKNLIETTLLGARKPFDTLQVSSHTPLSLPRPTLLLSVSGNPFVSI
jgi:hypothetical protein